MRYFYHFLILSILVFSIDACQLRENSSKIADNKALLNVEKASELASLPLNCISNPFPYKDGHTIASPSDLALPQVHHPAFYGCFDWHSAVHGHWSLVYLLKTFPDLPNSSQIRSAINQNITEENIAKEIAYFSLNKFTSSFERTYGWAWLLKLSEELYTWDDPDAQKWFKILTPLNNLISKKYIEYLPKLAYPIRVGEHSNTAFGLSFALDYAMTIKDDSLVKIIGTKAKEFYLNDVGCPISWEPSGYDFLSPCLQEMDIMRKVLNSQEFETWNKQFLNLTTSSLSPAVVKDRSDGKLVHLDGLNFSRAWCLYPLAKRNPSLMVVADEHLMYSLEKITDGDYMGEHWLATFALYAMKIRAAEQ